eukprot:3545386-Amphidinium_carterae.1
METVWECGVEFLRPRSLECKTAAKKLKPGGLSQNGYGNTTNNYKNCTVIIFVRTEIANY